MSISELFQGEFTDSPMSNADIINKRRIINGFDDGLMQASPLKHPWARDIFKKMQRNNWVAEEIPFQTDYEQWYNNKLTETEKNAFMRALAFASNLDGLLTKTLSELIKPQITSPEVCLALARQIYEEALHVDSYSCMIEALGFDAEEVYGLYRKDKGLFYKNKTVLRSVSKIAFPGFKTGTLDNDKLFLEACTTNLILEGVFFFSAFLIFYNFGRNNKMPGSKEMIQFINRDEDLHVALFVNIINGIREEQPELWTQELQDLIIQNVKDAVQMEYEWGLSCIGDGILGITGDNMKEYLQFIGDQRLAAIGLPKVWNATNPYPWIDELTQGNMIEVNFFEGRVKEYQTGTLEW
ncbi:MAG: ribonucleotide-diphosphate reductase subunit beta [Candidatus Margulisiibacteriota bacterium]